MLSKTGQDVLSGVQIGHKDSSPVRTHRKKPHDSAVQAAATSDFRPELHRLGWFVFQSEVFRWDSGGGVVFSGH